MEIKFEPLSAAEIDWVAEQIVLASRFVDPGGDGSLPSLAAIDEAWVKFLEGGMSANEGANAIVLCTGVAFGEHLVRSLGFAWFIATDDWGTDIALRARPGRGDITIFPTDYVSKRWESKETGFFATSFKPIADTLRDSAIDWGDSGAEELSRG